ncbi:MAG: CopG family transcriptional regulator [Promethearchaeota archaeon]
MTSAKTVTIPGDIIENIRKRIKKSAFSTEEDFIIFVLRILMEDKNKNSTNSEPFSEEEEERVMERLRGLGYL